MSVASLFFQPCFLRRNNDDNDDNTVGAERKSTKSSKKAAKKQRENARISKALRKGETRDAGTERARPHGSNSSSQHPKMKSTRSSCEPCEGEKNHDNTVGRTKLAKEIAGTTRTTHTNQMGESLR